jgi:hypothetical protein
MTKKATYNTDRLGYPREYPRPSGDVVRTVTVPGWPDKADADVIYIRTTITDKRWREMMASMTARRAEQERRVESDRKWAQERKRRPWKRSAAPLPEGPTVTYEGPRDKRGAK